MSGGLIKKEPCTKCGSILHTADEGKCGPVIKWIIVGDQDGKPARFIEAEDIMRCIDRPGDYGWVQPLDGTQRLIADFNQVFPTELAAKAAWIVTQRDRIANARMELTALGLKE